jgi:hypothetical protein
MIPTSSFILFLVCLLLVIIALAATTLSLNEFEKKVDHFCDELGKRYNQDEAEEPQNEDADA